MSSLPIDETQRLLHDSGEQAKRFISGFIDFACSGNILEIAFGFILANAFTSVTNSLVGDILLPPFSVLLPLNKNMAEKFAVLRAGPNYERLAGYMTTDAAKEDGAVILCYGMFIENVIHFICLGAALYLLANLYQVVSPDPIIKKKTKCRYCKKLISMKALRCINCTSWQDGREERMH